MTEGKSTRFWENIERDVIDQALLKTVIEEAKRRPGEYVELSSQGRMAGAVTGKDGIIVRSGPAASEKA